MSLILKATFADGEVLEQAFDPGDVIVLGYATDPYKRTVPLFELGQQIATVEIRTAAPNDPLPTFAVAKKPTSIIPTDCRSDCAALLSLRAELVAAWVLIEKLTPKS